MTEHMNERITRGLHYGAIGDALGYQVEFYPFSQMPMTIPIPKELVVSDDTQMALALARSVRDWIPGNDTRSISLFWANTIHQFLDWMDSPDNNRAPGSTCMGSLRLLVNGVTEDAPVEKIIHNSAMVSTGSGAVMRVFPVMGVPAEYRYALAWAQAIITHSDPRAAVAAMMVVNAAESIIAKGTYDLEDTRKFLSKINSPEAFITTRIPNGDWVRSLAVASVGHDDDALHSLGEYLEGIHEPDYNGLTLETVIDNAIEYVTETDPEEIMDPLVDIQDVIGAGGWDSVSAIGIALLGLHLVTAMDRDPLDVMYWLIRTGGDSDTVATVFGHLYGFYENNDLFDSLINKIEIQYQEEIDEVSTLVTG